MTGTLNGHAEVTPFYVEESTQGGFLVTSSSRAQASSSVILGIVTPSLHSANLYA